MVTHPTEAAETTETAVTHGLRYFKIAQVAEHLNIGLRTAYELVESGELSTVRMGTGRGTMRVPAESLAAYEAQLRAST